jgi:hypothetical protein
MEITPQLRQDILNAVISIEDKLGVDVVRVQVRFPRSKRKRIRKKWARCDRNFENRVVQEPLMFWGTNADGTKTFAIMNRPFYIKMFHGPDVCRERLQPTVDTHESFAKCVAAEIAHNLGLPQELCLVDDSGANYSAAKLDLQQWRRRVF